MDKVVIHMKDRTIYKGVTRDFEASSESFHLLPAEGGGVPMRLHLEDMKAVFYVRDFVGNSAFVARKDFDEARQKGTRVILRFKDGEEMWGTVSEASGEAKGFFFFPSDPKDNNLRIFVIRSSLDRMEEVS